MTPFELRLHVEEYNRRKKEAQDDQITVAYMTAFWATRAKKMPDLKELLGNQEPKEPQTAENMLDVVKALNAAFGGEVTGG